MFLQKKAFYWRKHYVKYTMAKVDICNTSCVNVLFKFNHQFIQHMFFWFFGCPCLMKYITLKTTRPVCPCVMTMKQRQLWRHNSFRFSVCTHIWHNHVRTYFPPFIFYSIYLQDNKKFYRHTYHMRGASITSYYFSMLVSFGFFFE